VICLLDTMIVSYFLEAGAEEQLAAAAKTVPMAIAEDVRRELRNDAVRGGKAFEKWLATSNIEVRAIPVGSVASSTLHELLKPNPGQGLGERASIALAAADATLTFVTHDKGALWIAVREIWAAGERVLGLAPFLRRLFEGSALTDLDTVEEIMSLAYKGAAQWPTWWPTWRAGAATAK
jgi:hypothetical protein